MAVHRIEITYCVQCRWLLRDRIDPARDLGHIDRSRDKQQQQEQQ